MEGSRPRFDDFRVLPGDHAYGPVSGTGELREAIARHDNRLYSRGKRSRGLLVGALRGQDLHGGALLGLARPAVDRARGAGQRVDHRPALRARERLEAMLAQG